MCSVSFFLPDGRGRNRHFFSLIPYAGLPNGLLFSYHHNTTRFGVNSLLASLYGTLYRRHLCPPLVCVVPSSCCPFGDWPFDVDLIGLFVFFSSFRKKTNERPLSQVTIEIYGPSIDTRWLLYGRHECLGGRQVINSIGRYNGCAVSGGHAASLSSPYTFIDCIIMV